MPELQEAKNTKATRLVDRLREAIVAGELAPGARINLDRARAAFGVSLSPLREALARLIAEGLVEFRDNRGYRVAPVGTGDLGEVVRLRGELEPRALGGAIEAGDVNWESDVMRALHKLSRAVRDREAPDALARWESAQRDFHMTLISGCGMPTLQAFCRSLIDRSDRYRRIFLDAATDGHAEIANAAVARDAAAACALLAEQIRRTGDAVAAALRNDARSEP